MSKPREGARAAVLFVCAPARLDRDLLSDLLGRGYECVSADSVAAARAVVLSSRPALALIHLPLPDTTAGELMRELQALDPGIALVVAGLDADVTSAAEAFDLGADDYLEHVTLESFLSAAGGALGVRRGDVQLKYLRQKDAPQVGWDGLVSDSPAMQNVVAMLRQICRRTSKGGAPTILMNGETGTGKGFFAKCIHYNGARRNQAFVEINCAALPPSLMEAELFGYERGAFTDAKIARMGLFEAANGGTLFLDEIGALPLDLQAKLLTAIEGKEVRRLGAHKSTRVDVQIVAATHENLEARAKQAQFRMDLFHRLNVVAVTLPPLRERGDDPVDLAETFIATICREYAMPARTLAPSARDWIRRYSWPGNVRELRNRIERIILLENEDEVRAEHFGASPAMQSGVVRISLPPGGVRVTLPSEGVPLEELERAVIREALAQCEGNVSRAARFLSITRQTLIYRIKKHGLAVRLEDPNLADFSRALTAGGRG